MVQMTGAEYAALVREAIETAPPAPFRRETVIRALPEPARFNLVHIITGMRRCGKTFYLFQLMNDLLQAGVPANRMFYFDFSDARLQPTDSDTLLSVVEEYWRVVPEARQEGCYLFLDEVQECDGWQGSCQRLAEHETVTLVITGSSSKVSSHDIATNFRGRTHVHEMWPLSFREFCTFRNIPLPEHGQDSFSPKMQNRYEAAYDEYLIVGGFPAVQNSLTGDRIELLQGYVRDVVARDVAERMGREDIALATQLAIFGLRNTGCDLSINELVAQLGEADKTAYWKKVNRLMELFGEAFLLHYLPEYSTVLKPGAKANKKVYAEDPGLAYAVSRANQQDVGKRLETAIYLELRRRCAGKRTEAITSLNVPNPQILKVDFLVGDALAAEPYALYQVTATMEAPKTRKREIGSLEAGMRYAKLDEGTIITLREQGAIASKEGTIRAVPAWQWSLT